MMGYISKTILCSHNRGMLHRFCSIKMILKQLTRLFYFNKPPTNVELHANECASYSSFGFYEILKPLIDDLKILETKGIQLAFTEEPLFGSVIQVTGDNLALNSLLGFIEFFSLSVWQIRKKFSLYLLRIILDLFCAPESFILNIVIQVKILLYLPFMVLKILCAQFIRIFS